MKNQRALNQADVKAVWKILKKRYGVKPVNYKKLFGRLIKRMMSRKFCRIAENASDFIENPERMICFYKYILLPYTAGKNEKSYLDEITDAIHETHHRFDQLKSKNGTMNWYRNYFKHKAFLIEAEVKATGAELSFIYALNSYRLKTVERRSEKIARLYDLSKVERKAADRGLLAQTDSLRGAGRGFSTSPVASTVINLMVERGVLSRN